MASFQFGPWVLWAILLELVVLLLISTWQKGFLKGTDSQGDTEKTEEPRESIPEEEMTLDQVAVVETEMEADR